MMPKVVIREINIPAPPGLGGWDIFAEWILQAERKKRAQAAATRNEKELPAAKAKCRGGKKLK